MAGRTGSSLITRPMASSFFCIAPPPSCLLSRSSCSWSCLLSRSSCSWSLASYTCSCQQGGVSSRRWYNYVHAGTILATEVHTKSDLPAFSSLAECTGDRHDRWTFHNLAKQNSHQISVGKWVQTSGRRVCTLNSLVWPGRLGLQVYGGSYL